MKKQEIKEDQDNEFTPYPPSWIDQLFTWIDGLWGPPWIFYLLVFLIMILIGHVTLWLEGSLPFGNINLARIAEQPLLLYFPVLMQYLNRIARRSLRNFQPILKISPAEVNRLEYELTTLPRSFGYISIVVGLLLGPLSVISQPLNYGLSPTSSMATLIYSYLSAILSVIVFIAFILHTIRQLCVVSRIHRMAEKINLFERLPVYAFSALTVRTGIGILIMFYYYTYIFFIAQLMGPYPGSLIDLSFVGLGLLVATGSFVLPLYGMHHRLVDEKTRLLAEADRRFDATLSQLHHQLDTRSLDEIDILNKAIASQVIEREALSKIPTWPWKPETLRGFLTSLVLPIIIWLLTTLLGRWIET